jgi:hypothetical protein
LKPKLASLLARIFSMTIAPSNPALPDDLAHRLLAGAR